MIIVQPAPTFLRNGAIIPTNEELNTVIHALIEETSKVKEAFGSYYGTMDLRRVDNFIAELEKFRKQRGL